MGFNSELETGRLESLPWPPVSSGKALAQGTGKGAFFHSRRGRSPGQVRALPQATAVAQCLGKPRTLTDEPGHGFPPSPLRGLRLAARAPGPHRPPCC